jgi:hypothetical protein
VSRAFAAGRTFSSRTLAAGWAARSGHTSVVDAAGAIYVIGGYGYQDVWASTDGGTRAGLRQGGGDWRVLPGYYRGTQGVPKGTQDVRQGYYGRLRGT